MVEGKPSATAELIALSAVFLSRTKNAARLLPPGSADLSARFLAASAPIKLAIARLLATPVLRGVVSLVERLLLPGMQLHYAARKRFIEDGLRQFLADGGRQVVVLGAGYDTLATRIALERPDVFCVEIDHPATQGRKRLAVEGVAPGNLEFVAADLSRAAVGETVRAAARFKPGAGAFFVLEGVTMYLSEAVVAGTLRACRAVGGEGTRIAWTFMQPDERGKIAFRQSRQGLINAWLSMKREPFTWGIAPEAIPSFLTPLGLGVREIAGADQLRERYLTPLGLTGLLAEGEAICLAEARP